MQIYQTLAQIVSYALHPLLMPTYAMLILFSGTFLSVYPLRIKLIYLVGVVLFTIALPVTFILLLKKRGYVSDSDISNRKQRLYPYLFTIVCYLCCFAFLYKTLFPLWGSLFFLGASVAMILNLTINLKWKISAHLTGIGGLMGGAFAVCLIMNLSPITFLASLVVAAGVLCTARIYLNQHTPLQTVAGLVCGFICVFLTIIATTHFF